MKTIIISIHYLTAYIKPIKLIYCLLLLSVSCRYRHVNLLTLMGYSDNGPSRCIVYEFMCNGALEDWLEGKVILDNKYIVHYKGILHYIRIYFIPKINSPHKLHTNYLPYKNIFSWSYVFLYSVPLYCYDYMHNILFRNGRSIGPLDTLSFETLPGACSICTRRTLTTRLFTEMLKRELQNLLDRMNT